jgi:hypothetical protein
MAASLEALSTRTPALKSSSLRKPTSLRLQEARLLVDPDGAVRSFDSLAEGRALFGYEQSLLYKVQAGVVVQAQKQDWNVKAAPRSIQLSGKVFGSIEVWQSIGFYRGRSLGYLRRIRLKNIGLAPMHLRMLEVCDPTAAQLGPPSEHWGSLGMNAFNRSTHVAMDEVSEPPSARVLGAVPAPGRYYMTVDRTRAQELLATGDLPEPTAGMSGQVIVLSSHDMEVQPFETKEVAYAAIYNSQRLEEALADFARFQSGEKPQPEKAPRFACPNPDVTEAAQWALSSLEGVQHLRDPLDRYECLNAARYVSPQSAEAIEDAAKLTQRRDGSVPHSMDQLKPGVLETAVLLRSLSAGVVLSQDKKAARKQYSFLKKLAVYLLSASEGNTVRTDPSLPQGWRRLVGTGYPLGELPEISLALSSALSGMSQVSRLLGRSADASAFRERAHLVSDRVAKRLVDERGYLCLCSDAAGKNRSDDTVDMAVAAYRGEVADPVPQGAAHRLLDKDFETSYGPRCVPTSNRVYFNGAYGHGQLGGLWTRAALAHAILCYRTGLSGVGNTSLVKVSRLVAEDAVKLGGAVGEFPLWVDPDRGEAHGEDSDPVAAARFIEALVEGELGLTLTPSGGTLDPPASSGFGWVLASDIWAGGPLTAFVGRGGGRSHIFYSSARAESREGTRFEGADPIELPARGVVGVSFHGAGQVICIGNETPSPARLNVDFSPRGGELAKRLSTPLEAYDPASGTWAKVGTLRVNKSMAFEASLAPEEWKAFRVSNG